MGSGAGKVQDPLDRTRPPVLLEYLPDPAQPAYLRNTAHHEVPAESEPRPCPDPPRPSTDSPACPPVKLPLRLQPKSGEEKHGGEVVYLVGTVLGVKAEHVVDGRRGKDAKDGEVAGKTSEWPCIDVEGVLRDRQRYGSTPML